MMTEIIDIDTGPAVTAELHKGRIRVRFAYGPFNDLTPDAALDLSSRLLQLSIATLAMKEENDPTLTGCGNCKECKCKGEA